MSKNHLPAKLQKRPFTYKDGLKAGLTRRSLASLLDEGVIERVCRGVYQMAGQDQTEVSQFQAATMSVGKPCVVCLLSALAVHNLTDEIPRQVWLMVDATKRTSHPSIRLVRVRGPIWNIGVLKEPGYSITTPARTVIDCLLYKRLLGTATATAALRRAIEGGIASPAELLETARKLNVLHRVRPYLEALV